MSKVKLKLVETIPEVIEEPKEKTKLRDIKSRNFWNSCPKKLDSMPCSGCDLGRLSLNTPEEQTPPCDWSINSEEHHFCFWKFVQDTSLPDGRMDNLMQNQISQLMNTTAPDIHFLLKEAVAKLQKTEHLEVLQDYYSGNTSSGDLEMGISVPPEPSED